MDAVEQLKKIGLDKVSKETRIYIENLKSLLDKDFNTLHKTKTFGFIKILEKKYNIDLSSLKNEYQAYLDEHKPKEEKPVTITPPKKNYKKSVLFYTILFLIVLMLLSFYFIKNLPDKKSSSSDLNVVKNSIALEETKKNLESFENNQTLKKETPINLDVIKEISTPLSITPDTNDTKIEPTIYIDQTLLIEPATSLWVGIIYLDTYQRKSYLTSQEIELDPSRDQLILTGHSQFDIFHNGESAFFSSDKKVRFLYQDGTLSEITKNEFKDLNGGVDW